MNPRSKQQLIDWLFNMIGTEHFNMSNVVGSTLYECGTTLCLLGAAEAFVFRQDIDILTLAETDYCTYLDQLQAAPEYYALTAYHRALEWLGFTTAAGWREYSLFFFEKWPQPYQGIYLGDSNICDYVVNSEDVCCCRTFYRPLAGILLLTDMSDDEDSYLGYWGKHMEFNDDESFYERHESLIQRCISKFRTTL